MSRSPRTPGCVNYFTQWFSPEPVLVPVWIARSLRRRGFDLRVHTAVPNFPTGKVLPGYSAKRFSHEVIDGFEVSRSPLYPSHDQSALRRILNYGTWAVTSSLRAMTGSRAVSASLVYGSPATAAIPAMVAKTLHKVPYVLVIQDLWPDSVTSTGLVAEGQWLRFIEGALHLFTNLSYRMASRIAVISPGMRQTLIDRGVPPEKVHLVYNWVDEDIVRPLPADTSFRSRFGLRNEFLVMYGGNFGAAQSLGVCIEAMTRLPDDVHLVLVGDGIEKAALVEQAERLAPHRVHFVDPLPPHKFPAAMAAADVQIVCLRDDPLFAITMPSKVQSILASGRPAVASAPGDAGRVIEESGAGWATAPGDPTALASAIEKARAEGTEGLQRRGDAARRYYESHLSEQVNGEALAGLLRDTIQEGHTASA